MDKVRIKIDKDEATIEEGEDSFMGKLIAGCTGEFRINTPRGQRKIKKVKNSKGEEIKRPKKPKKSK